jgi:hypothetical protein
MASSLLLSSCSASWPVVGRIPVPYLGEHTKGVAFESEEYVVYILQGE